MSSERPRGEQSMPFVADVARAQADEAVAEHEQRMHAGTLPPFPSYLWPQRGPLGESDMVIALDHDELIALAGALATVASELAPDERLGTMRVLQREGSPWIELDVVVTTQTREARPYDVQASGFREYVRRELAAARVVKLALWRYTLDVYFVDSDGAVRDDPIVSGS